ncbi:MAG: signal peptide peptidase SppA [Bacillus sp. (in: firmicutes)]
MNGKRWAALGIAGFLFFASVLISLASSVFFAADDEEGFFSGLLAIPEGDFYEEYLEEGAGMDKIAVLQVNGVIQDTGGSSLLSGAEGYNHRTFMEKLNWVQEDEDVKGIVIQVNSPGGGVVESAEIYHKIKEIQEETEGNTGKPVYISMGGTAASGGYYISAPAKKIYATPETLTGSLGVIMQSINYAELAENIGIETVTIKSGPYKDIMSGDREMTKEEREILQGMIDNSYNQFVSIIAEGRGMSEAEVRKLADGRIYDGLQAKEAGLIDEFGYLEDVTDAMRGDLGIEDASVVTYTDSTGFESLFSMSMQKLFGDELNITSIKNSLTQGSAPRLMYLYTE